MVQTEVIHYDDQPFSRVFLPERSRKVMNAKVFPHRRWGSMLMTKLGILSQPEDMGLMASLKSFSRSGETTYAHQAEGD